MPDSDVKLSDKLLFLENGIYSPDKLKEKLAMSDSNIEEIRKFYSGLHDLHGLIQKDNKLTNNSTAVQLYKKLSEEYQLLFSPSGDFSRFKLECGEAIKASKNNYLQNFFGSKIIFGFVKLLNYVLGKIGIPQIPTNLIDNANTMSMSLNKISDGVFNAVILPSICSTEEYNYPTLDDDGFAEQISQNDYIDPFGPGVADFSEFIDPAQPSSTSRIKDLGIFDPRLPFDADADDDDIPALPAQVTNVASDTPDNNALLILAIDELKAKEFKAKKRGLDKPDAKSIKIIVSGVLKERLEIYERFKGKITDKESLEKLNAFLISPIKIHSDLFIDYDNKIPNSDKSAMLMRLESKSVIPEVYKDAIRNIKREISEIEIQPERVSLLK